MSSSSSAAAAISSVTFSNSDISCLLSDISALSSSDTPCSVSEISVIVLPSLSAISLLPSKFSSSFFSDFSDVSSLSCCLTSSDVICSVFSSLSSSDFSASSPKFSNNSSSAISSSSSTGPFFIATIAAITLTGTPISNIASTIRVI